MQDTSRTVLYSKALAYDTSGNSTTTLTKFGEGSATYRLIATTDCGVNFGTTATSDGTSCVLLAMTPEYFDGVGVNIAAKGLSANGTLYISCVGN